MPEPNGRFRLLPSDFERQYGEGKPIKRRMHELRRHMMETIDVSVISGIMSKLGEAALEGDWTAAGIYMAYAVGKPVNFEEMNGKWKSVESTPESEMNNSGGLEHKLRSRYASQETKE